MTNKDSEVVAAIIRGHYAVRKHRELRSIAQQIADYCEGEISNFDRVRFYVDCGMSRKDLISMKGE